MRLTGKWKNKRFEYTGRRKWKGQLRSLLLSWSTVWQNDKHCKEVGFIWATLHVSMWWTSGVGTFVNTFNTNCSLCLHPATEDRYHRFGHCDLKCVSNFVTNLLNKLVSKSSTRGPWPHVTWHLCIFKDDMPSCLWTFDTYWEICL